MTLGIGEVGGLFNRDGAMVAETGGCVSVGGLASGLFSEWDAARPREEYGFFWVFFEFFMVIWVFFG